MTSMGELPPALPGESEYLREIASIATDVIVLLDRNGKRLYVNPAFVNVFGSDAGKLGADSFASIHPDDRERIKALFSEVLARREGSRAEYRIIDRNGNVRYFESQSNVITSEDSNCLHVVVVSRETTERRLFEDELSERNRILQERIAARAAYMEVLGFVAHELKNPVSAMITNARLINEGYLGDVVPLQREKIERIIQKGEYLIDLVRDYLDLALVENDDVESSMVNIDDPVAEVFLPSIDQLREQLEQSGMILEKQFPEAAYPLTGDPALLRIVVVNLLSNAIKYGTPGGQISISLKARHENWELSVWNEGPGFPPDKQDELFRRFSRLHEPALFCRKGTGIGLYTCWKIAQRHNGRIWADSQEGQWASFNLSIPRRRTAH